MNTGKCQKTICNKCGRENIGYQANCLSCGGKLTITGESRTRSFDSGSPGTDNVSEFCTSCGQILGTDLQFCTNCGVKIETAKGVHECSDCGAVLQPDQQFCIECGKKTGN